MVKFFFEWSSYISLAEDSFLGRHLIKKKQEFCNEGTRP